MTEKLQRFKEANPIGKIDKDNGIIYGVSVITGNREASGHEMYVDDVMVDQVVEHGSQNKEGLKARFDHPNPCGGSMGTVVGRFKNFRRDGLQARADLYLLASAADSPAGDYRTYILNLAEEDPNAFATSIVFRSGEAEEFSPNDYPHLDENDPFFYPHARIKSLTHCDVVDEGAANDGLFGRPDYLAEQAERWSKENPQAVKAFMPILLPFIEEIVNNKFKDMSTVKLSPIDRVIAWYKGAENKTDEQLLAEYNEIKGEVTELQKVNEDNERTIAEMKLAAETFETSLSELKEGYETKITELTQTVADLTAKLSAPAEDLPLGETEAGSQEISATEETEAQLKIKKTVSAMKANIDFIEEQKKKKVGI
jgi:hypothetical protein